MKTKNPSVSITHLSKSFADKKVLKSIDLELSRGDIYALIGPNGSGKTTLIKSIVGLQKPDVGAILLFGNDIEENPIPAKKTFGYVSDSPTGYDFLTGLEYLSLAANLKGIDKADAHQKIRELSDIFPIADILTQPMAHYSRGNVQKVSFLASLLGSPQMLVIDEPVVGLDPDSISIFGHKIAQFAKAGGIVLFVTHTLWFAKKYANRFGLLVSGRIVSEGEIIPTTNLDTIYQEMVAHENS